MKKQAALTLTAAAMAICIGATSGSQAYQRGGLWRLEVAVDDLIVPGMSEAEVAGMKAGMAGRAAPVEICIAERPPEAHPRPGDPVDLAGMPGQCSYTAVELPGTPVARTARCVTGAGNDTDLTLTGNITPEAYAMTARISGREADAIVVVLTERGTWLGECPAGMEVMP